MRKLTTQEFISRAKKIHGDKYDYSKVNYINKDEKVCIICPKHGEFWQSPHAHVNNKQGCPKCGGTAKLTTEEFISKAKKIYGDKYDYSKVDYKDSHTKVCIICPKHGEFWQRPNDHLSGYECPKCSSPHLENEMRRYLNLNNIQFEEQKTWEWLLYKGKQRVDFYLPEYNIVIECQGIQHFVDKEFFNKEISFEERKLMDKNKKDLCELHGIKIFYYSNLNIEYPYKVYKDIETLINEIKTNLTN